MSDDLAPLPPTPTGRYRHYKGGEYEVVGVARHSETLEPLVVYRPLYNESGLWVRPHAMFFGDVEIDGVVRPRFARIGERAAESAGAAVSGAATGLEWTDSLEGVDWQELSDLYRAAPLGDKPADHLQQAFGNSRYHCFARDAGRLVAVGRVVADGCDVAYLCDIAVLPSHQGTGLGRQVVDRLLALSKGHRKTLLYAAPGKEPFYRRFGFLRMRTAMALFPEPAAAVARGYLDEA